jgi:hypothetical protein
MSDEQMRTIQSLFDGEAFQLRAGEDATWAHSDRTAGVT